MRTTLQIQSNTTLNNILKDYQNVFNVMNQMATGQRVNNPSDDPLATNEGMRLDSMISKVNQYNRNIITGTSFLGLSDGIINNMNTLLKQAKSLTIGSASETSTHDMRQANAVEINSTLSEIVSLANSMGAGRYLFGGTETQTAPYQVVGSRYVYYRGNEDDINIQVDSATNMAINTTGEDVFGSMTSTITSKDLSPDVTFGNTYATRLEDLNNGIGVPAGSINIKYSAFPDNGLIVDLSDCDTIEDVAQKIESATLKASKEEWNPDNRAGAPYSYLAKRYIKVEINEERNGIQLIETDDVWEATKDVPESRPPDYPGFTNPSKLSVSDVAGGMTASRLGITGTTRYSADPLNTQQVIPQALVGRDLDPQVSDLTLLADLQGYVDSPFTITNGALPEKVGILEINDTSNNFSDWTLNGLTEGQNTDKDGELYIKTEETYTGSGEYYINIYKSSSYLEEDLVAQGTYEAGLIDLEERNSSGITGTVSMPTLTMPISPTSIKGVFNESFTSTISVPAYEKELDDLSYHDVISDFRLRGMSPGRDPQDLGYDNTDADGNFNLEVVTDYAAVIAEESNNFLSDVQIDYSGLPDGYDEFSFISDGTNINVYPAGETPTAANIMATGVETPAGSGNYVFTANTTNYPEMTDDAFSATATVPLPAAGTSNTVRVEETVNVNVYNNDINPRSLIATGELPQGHSQGTVDLHGVGNFDYLTGSVYIDWDNNIDPATGSVYDDPTTSLPQNQIKYNMRATFATVEDLTNAINMSNTYTTASVSDDGNGIDITSHLAGAHMIITENIPRANHYNDYGQLGEINLTSVINNYNTDYDGKIYTNINTTKGDEITIGGNTCTIYDTEVLMYNDNPQDSDFDADSNLVGTAKIQTAYDSTTDTWYKENTVSGDWEAVTFPEDGRISINQSNHSGLEGTLVLNSIRIPESPYETSTYFDTEAAAGEKHLEDAIVINTKSYNFTSGMDGDGAIYDQLEYATLTNAINGINTDNDGNIHATVGFKVTEDDDGLINQLNLNGIIDSDGVAPTVPVTAGNTDSNGKLYAVTSYSVTGEDVTTYPQMQQLEIRSVTRETDSSPDSKIYVTIDAATRTVSYYNDSGKTASDLVATSSIPAGAGPHTVGINPVSGLYSLKGNVTIPDTATNPLTDEELVIDLTKSSVTLYNDSSLTTDSIVAAGNSDSNGDIELTSYNDSNISGSLSFPIPDDGKLRPTYAEGITIDTREREVVLYADAGYSQRVGKGDFANFAGGAVSIDDLNESSLGGTLNFNNVVDSTDENNQVQNLSLDGIKLGANTSLNGMLYMGVEETPAGSGDYTVTLYDSDDPAGTAVASGTVDMNTGVVNLSEVAGSGISGSVTIANPPNWDPIEQNTAGGLIHIDVSGQNPELLISQPLGMQNSGEHREENIFTTLNDVLDAMNNDDVEALHELIEKFKIDHDRVLTSQADIGTRVDRLELLESRHDEEVTNFTKIRASRISLDYSQAIVEYQASQNVFDAALKTTAQLVPMSLVDYV